MLRRFVNALSSSVGRKAVMGLTGLLLVGFLVMHLLGNLKLTPMPLLGDPEGGEFDKYVAFLKSFGPWLLVAEVGLFALFAAHIVIALRLTMENHEARKQKYVIRSNRGAQTVPSASMHITGALVLAFIIKHIFDFRLNDEFNEAPAEVVGQMLGQPVHGLIYLLASLLVGLHVSHGFRSAFQSLGASHPAWNPLLIWLSRGLALVIAVLFASIPAYFLFSQGGAH